MSSITGDAITAIKEVRKRVPMSVRTYIENFDADLDDKVTGDGPYWLYCWAQRILGTVA